MKLAQKLALHSIRAKLNMLALFSKQRAAEQAFAIFCTPFRRTRKPEPPIFKQAERLPLLVDNIRVAGYRWNKGQGERIMIIHGFESAARNFERYIVPLVKMGYEVISLDAPAHGASGGKQITLPLYLKSIDALIAETGLPVAAMAHSFGALTLMLYLEKNAMANSCRTVLLAPATESNTAIKSLFRLLHLSDNLRPAFDAVSKQKGYQGHGYYSIPRILQVIQPPILWVHDEEDEITPIKDVQPIIAKAPAHIEFMITRGWGHRQIYRENKVQKKVISFLTGLPIPTAQHRHKRKIVEDFFVVTAIGSFCEAQHALYSTFTHGDYHIPAGF